MDISVKITYIRKKILKIMLWMFVIIAILSIISIPSFIDNGAFSKSYEKKYILTDGNKIIVFQEMNHVALTSFYKEVGEEMNDYRNNGYQILLEGLKHNGTKPLKKTDSDYLIKSNNYNILAEEYREKNKKYFNDKYTQQMYILNQYYAYDDEYADLSEQEYNDIVNRPNKITVINAAVDHLYNKKIEKLRTVTDHTESFKKVQKDDKFYILRKNISNTYYIKKINNFLVDIEYWYNSKFTENGNIFYDVVMLKRNKIIADTLINSESKKIYIHYGSAHFDGVLYLLKKENPNWKIVEVSRKVSFNTN